MESVQLIWKQRKTFESGVKKEEKIIQQRQKVESGLNLKFGKYFEFGLNYLTLKSINPNQSGTEKADRSYEKKTRRDNSNEEI